MSQIFQNQVAEITLNQNRGKEETAEEDLEMSLRREWKTPRGE